MSADAEREWLAPYRVDLLAVLGPWQRGGRDPAFAVEPSGAVWRTSLTPDGPATQRLSVGAPSDPAGAVVRSQSWGPGAAWVAERLPVLLGSGDDPSGFPDHLLPEHLQRHWRTLSARWRVPRSERVLEALVPAILEQKVTGVEARRAWSALLREEGEPAPGPVPRPMRVPPAPERIAAVASWRWHRWGVQPAQSATLMRAVRAAGRLEECVGLAAAEARRRLGAVPGIGAWTTAEVGSRALGDADAVSVGDFHLAGQVVYAFTGDPDGDDARMLDLLEPFAGHRHRVQRLVGTSGITRPRRGPRMTIPEHRRR